jgi:hypothetical protein
VRWCITPNKKGQLVVKRSVQKGFRPLAQFTHTPTV